EPLRILTVRAGLQRRDKDHGKAGSRRRQPADHLQAGHPAQLDVNNEAAEPPRGLVLEESLRRVVGLITKPHALDEPLERLPHTRAALDDRDHRIRHFTPRSGGFSVSLLRLARMPGAPTVPRRPRVTYTSPDHRHPLPLRTLSGSRRELLRDADQVGDRLD